MTMDIVTRELRMFRGKPIDTSFGLSIYPLTVGDIEEIGYEEYSKYLLTLCAEKRDYINVDLSDEITAFDIFKYNFMNGYDSVKYDISKSINIFLKSEMICDSDDNLFLEQDSETYFLGISEFIEIQKILREQNSFHTDKEFDGVLANKKAEEIQRKIMKGRASLINKKGEVLFSDLVSVLAAKGNGINVFNVYNLSIYAFHEQFARIQMIENYHLSVKSLLAGADKDKVKLQHYVSRKDSVS